MGDSWPALLMLVMACAVLSCRHGRKAAQRDAAHRAIGLTHHVGRTAPPSGSRPAGPPAASSASTVALLRFSALSWRIGPAGRDAGHDQHEKGGLGHGSRRLPWLTLVLAGLVAMLFFVAGPAPEALLYDRAAIGQGEFWRLVTGHLVHSDFDHLGWNLAALLILGGLLETTPGLGRRGLSLTLGAGTIAVSAALWWGIPALAWYCGLSGVLNAVYVALLAGLWRQTGGRLLLILLVGNALKIAVEIFVGAALFTDPLWPSVPAAHAAGYLAGIAATAMIGGPGSDSSSFHGRTLRAGGAPVSVLGA